MNNVKSNSKMIGFKKNRFDTSNSAVDQNELFQGVLFYFGEVLSTSLQVRLVI
jgi:hypothetical protein